MTSSDANNLETGTLVVVLADPGNPSAPHGLGRIAELRPVGAEVPRAALVEFDTGPTAIVGLSRIDHAA